MRQYTGKYNNQISAGAKAEYWKSTRANNPTEKQVKYWKQLMAVCNENNIPFQDLKIIGKLFTKQEYQNAISRAEKHLVELGLWKPSDKSEKWKADKEEARRKEFEETDWIRMDEKLPDTTYVKTLDKFGRIFTLKWSSVSECFVSPYGVPVLNINNNKHKYRKPIAWAYIEE